MAGIDDLHLSDSVKKIFLAGVGAVAKGAEKGKDLLDKSKDVIDDLVKKGELTVEQGKILNQELKHKAEEAKAKAEAAQEEKSEDAAGEKKDLDSILDGLSAEEIEALREKIDARKSSEPDSADSGDKEE